MNKRIDFVAWGRQEFDTPSYAVRREYESEESAVARAIARKNKAYISGCGPYPDGIGYGSRLYRMSLERSNGLIFAEVYFSIEDESTKSLFR